MVCLETSLIIDILRGTKEAIKIEEKIDDGDYEPTVATPTIMELIKGAELSTDSKLEKEKIYNFLRKLTELDLGKESAILAGEIHAELIKKGSIIDIEDIMIGAIASYNNEILITRNKKHFERIPDLKIESYLIKRIILLQTQ